MRRLPFFMLILLACAVQAFGATSDIDRLRWARPLTAPQDIRAAEVGSVVLDTPIYDNVAADFADMRLTKKDNTPVPFVVKQKFVTEKVVREVACPSEVDSLKKLDDNKIEVVVRRKNTAQPVTSLSLETSQRNFEKLVSVFGSDDGKAWKVVAIEQSVFDYARIIDLSKKVVDLPSTNFLYYKVLIDNFSESKTSPYRELIKESRKGEDVGTVEKTTINIEPMKIDGVSLKSRIEENVDGRPSHKEYPIQIWKSEAKPGATVVTLASDREPLVSIELATQEANFSRAVSLCGGDNGNDWTEITRGRIAKLKLADMTRSEMAIPFPARRFQYYQLTIENGDSPALTVTSALAVGNVYRMEFLTAGLDLDGLTLYYGGEKFELPKYDLNDVLGSLKAPSFATFGFAEPLLNQRFKGPSVTGGYLDQRWLFYAVIIMAVLVLALALMRSLKKIEEPPPPSQNTTSETH